MENEQGSKKKDTGNNSSHLTMRTLMSADNVFFDDPKVKIERIPRNVADKYIVKVTYEPVWVNSNGDFNSTGEIEDVFDITRQVNQIQVIFRIIERDDKTYKTGYEAYEMHCPTLLKIGKELNEMFGVWLLYAVSKIIHSKNENHYNLLCDAWSPLNHW
tara:strand:+ start:33928 stop:34404 length:477 start_codon:yes stop_codon:yes gene_type:complete